MHSINIDIPEAKRLEVNGMEFEIMVNDTDIIQEAFAIEKMFKDRTAEQDRDALLSLAIRAVNYVDKVLGEGAMNKICRGHAVKGEVQIEIMSAICIAVMEIYGKRVEDEYA